MNPYTRLGSATDAPEAPALAARLTAWHDAMVAHERRLRMDRASAVCRDECPHVEARELWSEALTTFGSRAQELAFLRSRAISAGRPAAKRTPAASTKEDAR